jgi:hypothetical protein
MADFTDKGIEPKWTGICAAWAIISPLRSKMAEEESRLSLMLGEKAVLLRVTPISSEIEENRFLNTSNKIGFSFTVHFGAAIRAVADSNSQYPTSFLKLWSMESWSKENFGLVISDFGLKIIRGNSKLN